MATSKASARRIEKKIENEGVPSQGPQGDHVPQGNQVPVDPTSMTNE